VATSKGKHKAGGDTKIILVAAGILYEQIVKFSSAQQKMARHLDVNSAAERQCKMILRSQ